MDSLQPAEGGQYSGPAIAQLITDYGEQPPVGQLLTPGRAHLEPDPVDPLWHEYWDRIDVASQCEAALLSVQMHGVLIPEPAEVRAYLVNYSDMVDLVERVCEATLARFPRPSQVALELYQDPEIEDEHLTIYVRQHHYDDLIIDAIREVSRQFDDALCGSSAWLLLTTDFQDPLSVECPLTGSNTLV
ncbi:MAG: hypothetical protein JW759_03640 [Candidatus Coatesbacteria bacterium]|nr:hypothetical protein [Candidatus Coatesbacteria bacterium]